MIVSKSVVFIHIPRTAGVAITEVLRANLPNACELGVQHAGVAEARAALGSAFDTRFKFAVVRCPIARLKSWCALLDAGAISADTAQDAAQDAASDDSALAYWVDRAERVWPAIDTAFRDAFLPTQWSLLAIDGVVAVDTVGCFERLGEDWAALAERIGVPGVPLVRIRPTIRPVVVSDPDRLETLVRAYYPDDFVLTAAVRGAPGLQSREFLRSINFTTEPGHTS